MMCVVCSINWRFAKHVYHLCSIAPEFTLTFSTSILPTTPQGVLNTWIACKAIIYRAPQLITNCKFKKIVSSYGIADVTVQAKNATVWVRQKELMIQLNAKNREVCLFNVAQKVYFKGY
ncbi:unnamed protein product [Dicrocoelium dendriticum]|nr:unnamed protein product [Dicrocoelium dendriticum]